MSLCILRQDGEVLVHRHRPAGPKPFRKTVASYREDLVVSVACLFTWYWLAALWARAGRPLVLGPALDRKALDGGQAPDDKSDAQKMAVRLRGGRRPHADVSPAERRATRDRRRLHRMRKRAALLTHGQPTRCPYTVPEMGKQIASTAHRAGVSERFPVPAVLQSIAVELARIDYDDQLLRALELIIGQTAKPSEAHPLYLLPTVSGMGQSLRLVLLDALPAMARFPRVQDGVSYGRVVQGAQEAAGQP